MSKIQPVDRTSNQGQNHSFTRCNPFNDATIAESYEAWYITTGRRADRLEKALLKRLLASFPTAHTLLEIGCGTAHFTRWFDSQGLQVIGLDNSRPMLEEAKSLRSPPCLCGDALNVPLVTGSFDLVAMITTLEFLSDPLAGMAEAFRISRQGLVLGVLNRRSRLGWQLEKNGNPPWNNAHLFTLKELVRLIRQAASGDEIKITWHTTLWSFPPFALPLPWGGFIGMSVMINSKE
jgi:ubiquinone/menaquinone biosynthesis C-methylase UbiE